MGLQDGNHNNLSRMPSMTFIVQGRRLFYLLLFAACLGQLPKQYASAATPKLECDTAALLGLRETENPPGNLCAIPLSKEDRHTGRGVDLWPRASRLKRKENCFEIQECPLVYAFGYFTMGVRYIDVGSFRIADRRHGSPFASTDQISGPELNVLFGAQLEHKPRRQIGDRIAIACEYHTPTPAQAMGYQDQVHAVPKAHACLVRDTLHRARTWSRVGVFDPVDLTCVSARPAAAVVQSSSVISSALCTPHQSE